MDLKLKQKDYYLNVTKNGYLNILQNNNYKGNIPLFIQNLVLYDLYWQIKELINSPEKVSMLSRREQEKYLEILIKNFQLIDVKTIENFKSFPFEFYIIQGILGFFKKEAFRQKRVFIEDIDDKNNEILIKYYFNNLDIKEEIYLDGEQIVVKYPKIRQYDFLDKVFIYEKKIWVRLDKSSKELKVLLNEAECEIEYQNKIIKDLGVIYNEFKKLQKIRMRQANLWMFADMSSRADDNAEHLYRYVMQNHPKQKIVFALRKDSEDWGRLKNDGFKLVDPRSLKFKYLVFRASKIISSHIDKYMFTALGKETLKAKDFIFLQHGVTHNDVSSWLNQRKIDLFIT
ncbi:CDP-glycerol glycerophosphotransferase family protein, partial [Helicobacter burdigaliensis]|uniref:CDP-glycerol glycerophosphotransferase family protein n=1 Tax=Helicobacter burdigaliensis TaxID=2315334 RepID=UPI0018E4EF47